jgi:hypothetical protein
MPKREIVQPHADFYGDPHTTYEHTCRPPICPTCRCLLIREITDSERNQRTTTFSHSGHPIRLFDYKHYPIAPYDKEIDS